MANMVQEVLTAEALMARNKKSMTKSQDQGCSVTSKTNANTVSTSIQDYNKDTDIVQRSALAEPIPSCSGQSLQGESNCDDRDSVLDGMFPVTPLLHPRISSSTDTSPSTTACSTPLLDAKYHMSIPLPPPPDSDTASVLIPMCRICHMPEDDSVEKLTSPCRCAGTLQYIHNSCLKKWLEITSKKSRKPPKCELCHYQYHRHKKFKFHHFRVPRVSRQDKILHIIFFINVLIMIGCAVATVMCFLSDKGQINKFPRNKVDLTTEEIITLSCGVLFFVSFFISMTVQIKARHTVYQLCMRFIMQNMEWKIDEYDKSKDYKLFKAPQYL